MVRRSSERLCWGGGELLRARLLRACLRAAVGRRGLVWMRGRRRSCAAVSPGEFFFALKLMLLRHPRRARVGRWQGGDQEMCAQIKRGREMCAHSPFGEVARWRGGDYLLFGVYLIHRNDRELLSSRTLSPVGHFLAYYVLIGHSRVRPQPFSRSTDGFEGRLM